MLCEYITTGEVPVEELYDPTIAEPDPLQWLTGQLWNCTDIMPKLVRDSATLDDDTQLWTYGQAARAIREGQLVIDYGLPDTA
jgi:hypothetical protein